MHHEQIEKTCGVGSDPTLEIDSFAGDIRIRAGEGGVIRAVSTRQSPRSRNLNTIGVGIHEKKGGVVLLAGR